VTKRLIRSPADVFYYSGDANDDGCLAIGKDCWAAPKDLKGYWQWPFDLEVLILAGCSVLNITFPYDIANGPGRRGQRSLSAGVASSPKSWDIGIKLLLTGSKVNRSLH